MKYIPYDSRDILYKSIFGAVSDKDTVRFRLLLHRDAEVYSVYMKIKNDVGAEQNLEMKAAEWYDDNYRWYECFYKNDVGLYWYSFYYDSKWGRMDVTKFRFGEGTVSSQGKNWQLTVYDSNYKTPDSLSSGIIYQIFPDRFYNSGEPKNNIFTDRYIRDDWGGLPEYRQDTDVSIGKDYFSGDLKGITLKLDYIKSLGTSCIYLNPIFEAHSNHRYNTADYMKVDPLLGCESDLKDLCSEAKKRGIIIILDGVFSHTGDDSVYFNKLLRYNSVGAYNSTDSPYFRWYRFSNWPYKYKSWWGVPSLPEVDEINSTFCDFVTGENGVLEHWLDCGIGGFRLDVADELPDEFIDKINSCVKRKDPDALIIGEVWEDATNKTSYGIRRRYLLGYQLDTVMNYPFSNAITTYIKGGDAFELMDKVMQVCENYPRQCIRLLMNHIGTHDTARILTVLMKDDAQGRSREWQSHQKLSEFEWQRGKRLLKLAATIQYTLPGVPSLFYGDEAGLEGYGDPFCRVCYPWGFEDREILEFYKKLGNFRRSCKAFDDGDFIPVFAGLGPLSYIRKNGTEEVLIAVNRWVQPDVICVPDGWENSQVIFGTLPNCGHLYLGAEDIVILLKQ